jgi:peroxiredoxin Q/BCP
VEDLSRISEFAATRHDGERWSSKELEGTWALLWWYPKASTPGCAAEGRAFADHAPEFDEQGCTVFGLSLDTPQDNRSFRDEHDMPFALLSVDNLVATAFGVLRAVDSEHAERRSFLVRPDGSVAKAYNVANPEDHAQDVLDDLDDLLGG